MVVENDRRKVAAAAAAMRGTDTGRLVSGDGLLQSWRRTVICLRLEARCPRCSDGTYGSFELVSTIVVRGVG